MRLARGVIAKGSMLLLPWAASNERLQSVKMSGHIPKCCGDYDSLPSASPQSYKDA